MQHYHQLKHCEQPFVLRGKLLLPCTHCPICRVCSHLGLNPWKNINYNEGLHQQGMDVFFFVFLSFTWEPNLWLNSEVEITENMKEQLSV